MRGGPEFLLEYEYGEDVKVRQAEIERA